MGTRLEIKPGGESFNLIKIPPKMNVPMTMNIFFDSFSGYHGFYIVFNPSSGASEQVRINCPGKLFGEDGGIVKVIIPANTLITENRVDIINTVNNNESYFGDITKITITY